MVVQALNAIQGAKTAGKLQNDRLNAVLEVLEIKRCTSDYGVCTRHCKGGIVILNPSTDDILVATNNKEVRAHMENALRAYFGVTPNINPAEFWCLNWRIMQSPEMITMDQSDHAMKMRKNHFEGRAPPKYDVPF